ncbi:MAG: hypothetical protein ABIF77_01660 [bacterium]
MTRARSRIPLLPDFNLGNRQRRTHRYLDGVREVLSRGLLAPIDDGAFPHATGISGSFAPAVAQAVTLGGSHFLQDGVQAVSATDPTVANADVDWKAILPGLDGNDITLTIVDGGAVATTIAVVSTGITVTCNIAGGVTANALIAAIAADATAREMIIGVASGTGAANITAQAVTFSGGQGEGDYGVEIATVAQTVLNWSDTSISAELDLSGYSHGDLIEILILADGIEYRFNTVCMAGGGAAGGGRVGTGWFIGNAGMVADGDTFTINGREYLVYTGAAPGTGDVEILITAVNVDTQIDEIMAGVNADVLREVDAVPVGPAGAFTGLGFVPHSPAGNYALVHTLTNWVWNEGASPSAFVDGSANPLTLAPFAHTVSVADGVELAAGRWIQVASFPSATAPLLCGLVIRDATGSHYGLATLETQVAFDGATGMYNLQLLDPAGGVGLVATDIVSGFMAV